MLCNIAVVIVIVLAGLYSEGNLRYFGRTLFLRNFKIFWPDSILKEYIVIPHLSSLSMTLGLALITIVINDGVVEDDGRDDNLQLAKETYNISYIVSNVMPLENLAVASCTQSLNGVLQYKYT